MLHSLLQDLGGNSQSLPTECHDRVLLQIWLACGHLLRETYLKKAQFVLEASALHISDGMRIHIEQYEGAVVSDHTAPIIIQALEISWLVSAGTVGRQDKDKTRHLCCFAEARLKGAPLPEIVGRKANTGGYTVWVCAGNAFFCLDSGHPVLPAERGYTKYG